jgi:thioester reductase-like protein
VTVDGVLLLFVKIIAGIFPLPDVGETPEMLPVIEEFHVNVEPATNELKFI